MSTGLSTGFIESLQQQRSPAEEEVRQSIRVGHGCACISNDSDLFRGVLGYGAVDPTGKQLLTRGTWLSGARLPELPRHCPIACTGGQFGALDEPGYLRLFPDDDTSECKLLGLTGWCARSNLRIRYSGGGWVVSYRGNSGD